LVSIRGIKVAFSLLWAGLLTAAGVFWLQSEVELLELPSLLHDWLARFGFGRAALVYVVLYAIRPLVFFPAVVLTVASGMLFGPWFGILLTIVGENASANFAFWLARWFGRAVVANHETEALRRWDERIEKNGIIAVLTMRLIMLPFDLINFGCGLTSIRQRDFFIGTFIGILPALIAFVLLGGVAAAGVENRLLILGLSLFFLFLGLGVARWLKLRDKEA
jgi:uncharacterized membrane protein YdjX (TVP38/TMEM64 family)